MEQAAERADDEAADQKADDVEQHLGSPSSVAWLARLRQASAEATPRLTATARNAGHFGERELALYRVRPRRVVGFGFDPHNGGQLPVRLDGVVSSDDRPDLRTVVGLALQRDPQRYGAERADTRPFQPVEIPPGGDRFVVLRIRAPACARPRAGRTLLVAARFRFSYAGISHSAASVDLPAGVTFVCRVRVS
jgi:hypothetical protein